MTMKKADRKDSYREIIDLMLNEQHKEAFNKLTLMCGSDTGLFVMADYDEVVAKRREQRAEA